ncbi:MAG TPA: glycine betaine ABC transporter substrate-binding protein [Solirubrobacterales bacterium]|nr:glycine betaine ABC transporter substrate-binding protein [Solirubrobacterales bacterium]
MKCLIEGRGARAGRSLAALLLLAVLAGLAACGGSSQSGPTPTLTIGAGPTAEERILAQIYAQALRNAGFKVGQVAEGRAVSKDPAKALERGVISAYPGHLTTAIGGTWIFEEYRGVPADAEEAYEKALTLLGEEGNTAFPPTPFDLTNLVTGLRSKIAESGVEKVSELEGISVAGLLGCHEALNCAVGLEDLYGQFLDFFNNPKTVADLYSDITQGVSEYAMVPSTDGRLYAERSKFATLEEDRHLFPAGNAIFITSEELAEELGDDFETAIVDAQKGLTLPVMQRLDAEVQVEKRDPAKVAAAYLSSNS